MTNHSTASIALLGVPLNLGANNLGVADGPQAFRKTNIVTKLASTGLEVSDEGDIPVPQRDGLKIDDPKQHYISEIVRVSAASAARAEQLIRTGHRVLGLGGDHSITLGLASGVSSALNGDVGLIYLDAHGDLNTKDTTPSGNVHGMQLASLLGFGDPKLAHVHTTQTKITTSNLLHIGGSDWDQPELDLIAREKLSTFTLLDLLTSNLAPLFARIDDLARRVPNIYISLDLDVIDQLYAPAAAMPNAKGLTYREITAIAEYIGHTCHVVGIDVVEYNPHQDHLAKTAELGTELIAKFFGHNYSWYTDYLAKNLLKNERQLAN